MGARRSGGRRGDSRWELAPGEAGLRVVAVKLHQQYETPAAVMHFVRRKWAPTFDAHAMATPFSAICREYATIETDILRPESVPAGSVVLKKKGKKLKKFYGPQRPDNERVAHLRRQRESGIDIYLVGEE